MMVFQELLLSLQSPGSSATRAVLGGQALQCQPSWLRGFQRSSEEEEACFGHVLCSL